MIVYRLSRTSYANDLSGKGAELYGGRWNSKGLPMLYTASSRALCVVEILVHTPAGNLPEGYQMVTLEVPEISLAKVDLAQLPKDWNRYTPVPATQMLGDDFLRKAQHLCLKAPSAAVKGDFNILINPRHPLFQAVNLLEVEDFNFDSRLFEQSSNQD